MCIFDTDNVPAEYVFFAPCQKMHLRSMQQFLIKEIYHYLEVARSILKTSCFILHILDYLL